MKIDRRKLSLFAGSVLVVLIDAVFLYILNMNETVELRRILIRCILLLGGIGILSLLLFFWKGTVYDVEGKINKSHIMSMLIYVIVIIQLAFSFAAYTQKNQVLKNGMYQEMQSCIAAVETQQEGQDALLEELAGQEDALKYGITEICITNEKGIITASSESIHKGEKNDRHTKYTFPYFNKSRVVFFVDEKNIDKMLLETWINIVTALVIAVFFSVEVVFLIIKVLTEKEEQGEERMPGALSYIRQLAFLFYFASRLSASFITILAKNLNSGFFGINPNVMAGIPQSAETLFTCVAIFVTTEILTRKGWKLPFRAGLFLVAAGTFLSALAPNLAVFILARAIVGLGYGFCWMTLRNLALLGKNEAQQSYGFSMLNAGLYAGMNCGVSMGAILAENIGYRNVFFLAAGLTILCSLSITKMENQVLAVSADNGPLENPERKAQLLMEDKIEVVAFSVLMIAPACIAAAYLSYFLPLYFESLGRGVSDVGRAQLLYGIIIVYFGPLLSKRLASNTRGLIRANYLYNLIFSTGLLLVGIFGGSLFAFFAVLCLGVADSFGFSAQNNYFLAIPSVRKMGASKSLSYLSFLKKITEMMGPTFFSIAILTGYERGAGLLGIIFLAALVLYFGIQVRREKRMVDTR